MCDRCVWYYVIHVYGWVGVGHPSSFVVMGMDNVSVVDMGLPD